MDIHHSISQNTPSFLVEKIFDFKVDSYQKSPYSLTRDLFLVTFHHMWPRKYRKPG